MDDSLGLALMTASERHSNAVLETLAMNDAQATGRGRANTVLTLPINTILGFYRNILPQKRYASSVIEGHSLDTSVLAVLENVEVPQFQPR